MTLLKLAMGGWGLWLGGLRNSLCGLGFGQEREEHAEDLVVERELFAQLRHNRGRAGENDVGVEAGAVALVRDAGKRLAIHFLHRLNLAATMDDFIGNLVKDILGAVLLA